MVLTNDNGLHFLTTWPTPSRTALPNAVGAAAGLQTYLGQGFTFFNQNPKLPITIRWEAGLQRQFKEFLLETELRGQQEQSPRSHAQHQHPAAPVPEHAADARRHVQQPADRQHRQPAVQPGAGQQPGHLHRHHHLAADAAFAVSRHSAPTPSTPPSTPVIPGITARSSRSPSGSPRATRSSAATRSRSGSRPSIC